MATPNPHIAVREDWLAQLREPVIAPEQPIFDCHHHLWVRPEGRYTAPELAADVGDGHDVRASLFVQCRTGYRDSGPEELRPVGEVETVLGWSGADARFPVGLVAFADLQLGAEVRPVLAALAGAAEGRLRGIRNTTAFHPDPRVRSNPRPPPDGLLRSAAFLEGARAVAESGLVLDIWAYQTQLDEVAQIARAVPELTVVLDHCGGPLGVGPFRRDDPACFQAWRDGLARVADCPNTRLKIGGFGLVPMGYRYAEEPHPPSSERLARDWKAYFDVCLGLFGSPRAMFESNFPVDKGQFSYRSLWNAFKRLAQSCDPGERNDLFWRSAARSYAIPEHIFSTDPGRIPP